MKVVVRADASLDIGTGHVMRCLTLAAELRAAGAQVHFICRNFEGNVNSLIAAQGFDVHVLPLSETETYGDYPAHARWLQASWQDDVAQTAEIVRRIGAVDWLVVDHYAIDKRWEVQMRAVADQIMVVDDLADREHDCDILLDQNLYEQAEMRYAALVPVACRQFHGPEYALLRPEFREARSAVERNHPAQRILVFLGGADTANVTARVISALQKLDRNDMEIDVVVGTANPHREEIRSLCSELPGAHFHCNVTVMAKLMAQADLAVGAGGTTTWERCCVGLPAIVLIVADNQREVAQTAHRTGLVHTLGEAAYVSEDDIHKAIEQLLGDSVALQEMSRAGMALVDGEGARRIARVLISIEV